MKLSICATLLLVAACTSINAQKGSGDDSYASKCPNYQLKCLDCSENETCIYPDSGGCEGAGIPACKPNYCHKILCAARSFPCPKECPFTCRYSGPACCPFDGKPVCEPQCQTFAPCKVTKCPSECPGNCFYPDASYCCPNSGRAVCRRERGY